MNMPVFNLDQQTPESNAVVGGRVLTAENMGWQSAYSIYENQDAITEMLDQRFPLQSGSHKNVKQYVVYFRHLMAFFEDGSHCGLEHASQFVALSGHKETPEAIVLKEDDHHIEICFDCKGKRGSMHPANIEDIQLELSSKRVFTCPDGEDYNV